MPEVKVSELNIHYELDNFTNPWDETDTIWFSMASAGPGDSGSTRSLPWPASTAS